MWSAAPGTLRTLLQDSSWAKSVLGVIEGSVVETSERCELTELLKDELEVVAGH